MVNKYRLASADRRMLGSFVPPTREIRKRNISDAYRQLAERLRAEREVERFSQYELAREMGITRAALSNFELCQARLSFAVGIEFCRRLDVSPRWLATGEEPKRPFPSFTELGIGAAEVRTQMRRRVDFISGYEQLIAIPMKAWLEKNPLEKLIERQLRGGVEPLARRLSSAELIAQAQERIESLRKEKNEEMRGAHADIAEAVLSEIGARLEVRRRPALRGR